MGLRYIYLKSWLALGYEMKSFGQLIPRGGGDPIPLLRHTLLVGRRESCDICLRFGNVSAHHAQLNLQGGYWYVNDQGSRNGTKVNGRRLTETEERILEPGDILSVAKHEFEIDYSPVELGAVGPPPSVTQDDSLFGQSLMERAGLDRSAARRAPEEKHDGISERRHKIDDRDAPEEPPRFS